MLLLKVTKSNFVSAHLWPVKAVRPRLLDAGAHAVQTLVAAEILLCAAGPAPVVLAGARLAPGAPHVLDVAVARVIAAVAVVVAPVVAVAHAPIYRLLILPLLPLLLDLAKQQAVVEGRAFLWQTLRAVHSSESLVLKIIKR